MSKGSQKGVTKKKEPSLGELIQLLQKNLHELDEISQELVNFVKVRDDVFDVEIVNGIYCLD